MHIVNLSFRKINQNTLPLVINEMTLFFSVSYLIWHYSFINYHVLKTIHTFLTVI